MALEDMELSEEEQKMIEEGADSDSTADEQQPDGELSQPPPVSDPQSHQQEQKMVPLAALQEARAEIRAARQRELQTGQAVEQLRSEFLTYKQRQEAPKPPSYEDDPFGRTQYDINRIDQENRLRDQILVQQAQERQVEQQNQNLISTVRQSEVLFAKDHPDYFEAVQFAQNLRIRELQSIGITDPGAIEYEITNSVRQACIAAIQSGKNPAEAIYELAKIYGYQGKQPTSGQIQQRFDAIQKGQAATKTLKGGESQSPSTAESLLELEGDEFDRKWNEIFGKER